MLRISIANQQKLARRPEDNLRFAGHCCAQVHGVRVRSLCPRPLKPDRRNEKKHVDHTGAHVLPVSDRAEGFHPDSIRRKLLLQFGFDRRQYFGSIRLHARCKAGSHFAVLAHDELLKVPADVISLLRLALQECIQRILL